MNTVRVIVWKDNLVYDVVEISDLFGIQGMISLVTDFVSIFKREGVDKIMIDIMKDDKILQQGITVTFGIPPHCRKEQPMISGKKLSNAIFNLLRK